jgi:hypothetical protein
MEIILYTMVYPILLTFLFHSNWGLGLNPRFEGQTRAQRQGDFTNNSNNLPYKNLITFDTRVDSWLYNVMPILQPIQQICVGIPTLNSDPLQLFENFHLWYMYPNLG